MIGDEAGSVIRRPPKRAANSMPFDGTTPEIRIIPLPRRDLHLEVRDFIWKDIFGRMVRLEGHGLTVPLP